MYIYDIQKDLTQRNHPKHTLGLAGIIIISSSLFPSHEGLDNLDVINYVIHFSTLSSANHLFLGQKVFKAL